CLSARSAGLRLRPSGDRAPRHARRRAAVRRGGATQPAQPQRQAAGGGAPGGLHVSHRAENPRLQINARLVKERDRARARELRKLVLYGAAIVVPLLVYVWQRVEFLRISYEVEGLKKERQQLQDQNKQLGVERSFLLSPDRIERVARKELGLVDPQP